MYAVESEQAAESIALKNFQGIKSPLGIFNVFRSTVAKFLSSDQALEKAPYDIIFMDPPYELPNQVIEELLEEIKVRRLLSLKGILAIERSSRNSPFTWPAGMEEIKVRSYGQGSIFYGCYSASVLP